MNKKKIICLLVLVMLVTMSTPNLVNAEVGDLGIIFDDEGDPAARVDSIKLLVALTVLTLAPSFLILTTCFTRVVVVLSFLRNAMGTQQAPSNQLIIGLALFISFFVMRPVYTDILDNSITPYIEEEIEQEEALDLAIEPMKRFMLEETREKDLALFLRAEERGNVEEPMDLSMTTVIPAFAISELKTAFSIGFIVYIPFLVIDMVVASILMSMGMFMLPPVMISLPFKILLFVLVDGWHLVVKSLLESFA